MIEEIENHPNKESKEYRLLVKKWLRIHMKKKTNTWRLDPQKRDDLIWKKRT